MKNKSLIHFLAAKILYDEMMTEQEKEVIHFKHPIICNKQPQANRIIKKKKRKRRSWSK